MLLQCDVPENHLKSIPYNDSETILVTILYLLMILFYFILFLQLFVHFFYYSCTWLHDSSSIYAMLFINLQILDRLKGG